MKKLLSNKKTAIVLLVVTILMLGFYAYMLARPISYGMAYHNETEYEGGVFEGTMKFYSDQTMVNSNTNFEEKLESRYYYKDGYVFFTMAETDEAYDEEVDFINKNFNEATEMPFYADEINAFRLIATEGDGYTTVYTCTPAMVFAILGGVVAAALSGVTCVSWIFFKKKTNGADEITNTEVCESDDQ